MIRLYLITASLNALTSKKFDFSRAIRHYIFNYNSNIRSADCNFILNTLLKFWYLSCLTAIVVLQYTMWTLPGLIHLMEINVLFKDIQIIQVSWNKAFLFFCFEIFFLIYRLLFFSFRLRCWNLKWRLFCSTKNWFLLLPFGYIRLVNRSFWTWGLCTNYDWAISRRIW